MSACVVFPGKVDDRHKGKNVVDIAEELALDEDFAQEVGMRGQYLAAEILHPDNIQRWFQA